VCRGTRESLLGQIGEGIQPIQSVLDVIVLEARCIGVALKRILIGISFGLVVILEKVYEHVEHSL